MERIDKIIASQGLYSRSDVKYLVKHKLGCCRWGGCDLLLSEGRPRSKRDYH